MTASPGFLIITIDGGAASGKSTTARTLAERLDLMHVDTGSHYRSLCAAMLDNGIKPSDPHLDDFLSGLELEPRIEGRSGKLSLDGITLDPDALRSERVNSHVSAFAAQPVVRNKLLDYQRTQAKVAEDSGFAGLVMEGRDIGSVIFPDAPVRVFLHADPNLRANRRAAQGENDAIEARDATDSSRATAPLTCPDGAISIDTGANSVEEVVDQIVQLSQSIQGS
ncbi:MAG: (d)CMP kinase [Opitutales bacterium]